MPNSNYFVSEGVAAAAAVATADIMLMRSAAVAILTQPDVELQLVPTLPTSQNLARSHANDWLTTYQPWVLRVLTNVQNYSHAYTSFYPVFSKLTETISDPQSREEFVRGVQTLSRQITEIEQSTTKAEANLKLLQSSADDDKVRFETDAKTVIENYTGPDGDIQKLAGELKQLNQRLQDDNDAISKGITKALPGIAVIGVGVGVSWVSGKTGKTIIDAGLKLTKGEISDINSAVEDQSEAVDQFETVLTDLIGEITEVGTFQTIDLQVENFADRTDGIVSHLADTKAAWQNAQLGLNDIEAELSGSTAPDPQQLQQQLDDAQGFWTDVAKAIEAFEDAITGIQVSEGVPSTSAS